MLYKDGKIISVHYKMSASYRREWKLYRYRLAVAKGERSKLLPILDLRTRWGEWSVSLPGRALPLGKEPPVPIA
jgi:hypothetical protein